MNSASPTPAAASARAGLALAIVSALGFSAKAIFVKLAYRQGVAALPLLAMRMALSVPFFALALFWRGRLRHLSVLGARDWVLVVALGLLGYYLSSLFDFLGLEKISAGLERLILFLYPTFTVLLSAAIERRRVGRGLWGAIALSYVGVGLVFLHDFSLAGSEVPLGAALVFASTVSYTLYLVGADSAIARVGALAFTSISLLVASAACIGHELVTVGPGALLAAPAGAWWLALGMALVSTVMPVFFMSWAIARIGSGQASLVGTLGPVSTLFLAWIFLGEPVGLVQLAGAAFVLAGVYVVGLQARERRRPDQGRAE